MQDAIIIILSGAFAARIMKRLEEEKKDGITQKDVFEYLSQAAIETIESMKVSKKKNDLRDLHSSQN